MSEVPLYPCFLCARYPCTPAGDALGARQIANILHAMARMRVRTLPSSSFRDLFGRLKFTFQRDKFVTDSLPSTLGMLRVILGSFLEPSSSSLLLLGLG